MANELELERSRNILVCIKPIVRSWDQHEYDYLRENFQGDTLDRDIESEGDFQKFLDEAPKYTTVFCCGGLQLLVERQVRLPNPIKIIEEFTNDDTNGLSLAHFEIITLGQVPISVHFVGLFYRGIFGPHEHGQNLFDTLQQKHKFQNLTMGKNGRTSFRKGAYLSEVTTDGDASHFHLLRCSTNLDGPTLAFAGEDREIVSTVNKLARRHFTDPSADMNHVLAQVYGNSVSVDESNKLKEHKAKIASHSDKTKDMPANGLIAFCSFYSSDLHTSGFTTPSHDRFDRMFKDTSVLTRLRFRLKCGGEGRG